jgi:hypothetical protein
MATNTPAAPTDEMVERHAQAAATDIIWSRSHDARGHVIDISPRSYEEIERRIVSALTAAMQHGQEIPDGWRTIESAPKNLGQYLLGYVPDPEMPDAACIEVIWWEPLENSWFTESDCEGSAKPTHWQPLPAAPTAPIRK